MKPVLQSVLDAGGPDGFLLAQVSWVLIIGAGLIFAVVMLLLGFALKRGRSRSGDSGHGPGPSRMPASDAAGRAADGRWLLALGAGIPALLLLALLVFTIIRTGQLAQPSSRVPLRITITAHMWWWEVRYYDASTGREAVLANELQVPAGVPVYLALTSADVIHAFWLPSLAGKVDMVPGRVHGMTLQAERVGVYRGQCAEYCGAQHAQMALHLTAQQPAGFDAWLTRQAAPATATATVTTVAAATAKAAAADATGIAGAGRASIVRGQAAFVAARCTACHSVRGLPQQPQPDAPKAPDLTHIGSRQTIAAGALPMNKGTLAAWIADPQAIKPGARMPSASIDAEAVRDIAAWLESLQ